MDFRCYFPPALSPLQSSCTVSMDICITFSGAFPARMKLPILHHGALTAAVALCLGCPKTLTFVLLIAASKGVHQR